jgi:hypothetical protein
MFPRSNGIDLAHGLPSIDASFLTDLYDPRHIIVAVDPVAKYVRVLIDQVQDDFRHRPCRLTSPLSRKGELAQPLPGQRA